MQGAGCLMLPRSIANSLSLSILQGVRVYQNYLHLLSPIRFTAREVNDLNAETKTRFLFQTTEDTFIDEAVFRSPLSHINRARSPDQANVYIDDVGKLCSLTPDLQLSEGDELLLAPWSSLEQLLLAPWSSLEQYKGDGRIPSSSLQCLASQRTRTSTKKRNLKQIGARGSKHGFITTQDQGKRTKSTGYEQETPRMLPSKVQIVGSVAQTASEHQQSSPGAAAGLSRYVRRRVDPAASCVADASSSLAVFSLHACRSSCSLSYLGRVTSLVRPYPS